MNSVSVSQICPELEKCSCSVTKWLSARFGSEGLWVGNELCL